MPRRDPWHSRPAADRTWPARFNLAQVLCDDWVAEDPDRLVILHVGPGGDQPWSYGDLSLAAGRIAARLQAAGVGPGDRVAVILPQCPEVMASHIACYRLGAIVLPLFTLFGPDALQYRLYDAGAKVVLTDTEHAPRVRALADDLPDLRQIFTLEEMTADVGPPILTHVDTGAEDPAVMIYTSGTTGPPKGVLHAHRFLFGHLSSMEIGHHGFPQPGDRGWTPADWAWIGGLMDMAVPCLYYGVPLISHRMRKFEAQAAFGLMARLGVTCAFLPPTALKLMAQVSVPPGLRLRSITSGGESLGDTVLSWGRDALGVEIEELYGQTENNLLIGTNRLAAPVPAGAMGRAYPDYDISIRGEAGQAVTAGEVGQICVRTPNPSAFLRYWNKPDKTAEKVKDSWLYTGDLGRMDKDGFITFVARDDDVITSSGYRIGPTEIEHCLQTHPSVTLAAVVGLPDAERTEAVTAFVITDSPSDALAAELIQLVRDRISPHVAPRQIIWRDSLPMTATGKIMRRTLRDGG